MANEYREKIKERIREDPEIRGTKLLECLNIRVTEEDNIEISFRDVPACEEVRKDYRDLLETALGGGRTIYKTL